MTLSASLEGFAARAAGEARDAYDRATRSNAVRLFENPSMFASAARVLLKADGLSDEEILSRAQQVVSRELARRGNWRFDVCALRAAAELSMAARMRIAQGMTSS